MILRVDLLFLLTGGCMDPDPTPLPRWRISFR
uniref:mgtA leader peptide n=1 Tax=Pseudomonas tritici TaxID=2745518 RepID=A0A8H9YN97_9PSED